MNQAIPYYLAAYRGLALIVIIKGSFFFIGQEIEMVHAFNRFLTGSISGLRPFPKFRFRPTLAFGLFYFILRWFLCCFSYFTLILPSYYRPFWLQFYSIICHYWFTWFNYYRNLRPMVYYCLSYLDFPKIYESNY